MVMYMRVSGKMDWYFVNISEDDDDVFFASSLIEPRTFDFPVAVVATLVDFLSLEL